MSHHSHNLKHVSKLTPENKLKLFLLENEYPYEHIPKLLAYCPQLLDKYSLEELALACLSETKLFKPTNVVVKIRPFVYNALKNEVSSTHEISGFIEEAISILAKDTLQTSMISMIENTKFLQSFKKR